MAHAISGIVSSFRYSGNLANVILAGNFHFIVFSEKEFPLYRTKKLNPYSYLTVKRKKYLEEISFKGKCMYLETHFFVEGIQYASVWENGKCIAGPFVSLHGYKADGKRESGAELVENAINKALNLIGVYCHEGKDEFDSMRLGDYRNNKEVEDEFLAGHS